MYIRLQSTKHEASKHLCGWYDIIDDRYGLPLLSCSATGAAELTFRSTAGTCGDSGDAAALVMQVVQRCSCSGEFLGFCTWSTWPSTVDNPGQLGPALLTILVNLAQHF
jgi:hypothetical protein